MMKKPAFEFVAVDFDGTLCTDAFPEIGEPKPVVIEYVKKLAATGSKIILYTNRENGTRKLLDEAVSFCETQGIPLYAVNENPGNRNAAQFGLKPSDGRKVYADLYIDDKAINPAEIGDMIETPKPESFTPPKEALNADWWWPLLMQLAQGQGFILQSAAGTAVLATNRVQGEEFGEKEYVRIQRMNGRCPQEIGMPGCFDSVTGERKCMKESCELWRLKNQDEDVSIKKEHNREKTF